MDRFLQGFRDYEHRNISDDEWLYETDPEEI